MKKLVILLSCAFAVSVLVAGCNVPEGAVEIIVPEKTPAPTSEEMAKRYAEYSEGSKSAVESAIELSKENSRLSNELLTANEDRRILTSENEGLKTQNSALADKLEQAKRELSDADALLQEMVVELNSWKAQVIGFQNEIRDADKAQLDALIQILQLLGAEPQSQMAAGGMAGKSDANERITAVEGVSHEE